MAANGINGTVNGHLTRPLRPGIFVPVPTFFLPETEDLDIPSFEKQVIRLADAGVGPLLAGSMGEAHHLSHAERITLVQAARKALDDSGHHRVPIIMGTGGGSTRETIQLSKEAAAAGADYTIVILSGYFAGALAGNKKALKTFWKDVSAASPLPVIVYNYPGAAGGIDLDSEVITELAQECPNLCGVKLTCGNVGKLTRIADAVSNAEFAAAYPRKNPQVPFLVLGGFVDFLTPSIFANAHGAITGLGNVAPHTLNKLFQLSEATLKDPSLLPEAQRLQGIVARADYTIAKASIAGTKVLLEKLYGYGGVPRRPLLPLESEAASALWEHPDTQAIVKVERELNGKVNAS
ncbi:dihydrodipicolinate synthetase [Pleurotus eryngii]|uniref:Dihydrodipicolinate synthetase n=1 Tax=Pleurotus eryngii TaxID=5323 RepID=A0A9P6DD63_PLEER|nr:dihydrodipicolinate synthetase [Pleurotus eryngii]